MNTAYEQIAAEVCRLDRSDLVDRLTHFDGPIKLDFTAEALGNYSTDRMRHLLAAAIWRAHTRPAAMLAAAGAG